MVDSDRATDADAVGYVTISTPLFVPIEASVEGDRQLAFGDLRKEANLAAALQKPAFSASRIDYSLVEAAIAARIAGARLSIEDTKATGSAPLDAHRRTKTFETPDDVTAGAPPELDAEVLDKLLALLDR